MNSSVRSLPLIIPLWISVLYFATVHEMAQFVLVTLTFLSSFYILSTQNRRPPKQLTILLAVAFGCMLIGVLPLPLSLHHYLQPEFTTLTSVGMGETQAQWQPLSLRPRKALLGFILLSSCSLFLLAGGAYFYRIQRFYRSLRYIIGCAVGLCILAWIQKLTNADSIYWLSGIPTFYREPFFGSFVNPNHAGAFLAGVLPLCLVFRGPTKYFYLGFLLVGLCSTQSRGAILAGAVGLILYQAMATSGKWKWGFIAIVISLMGLAISFDISKTTNTRIDMENIQTWSSSRLEIWDASLSLLPKAPLIGTGKGGFVDAYAVVKQSLNHTVTNHTHQEIIEVLINFGWLGGGIFLFLWFYTIRCGFARIKSTKPKQEKRWVIAALSGFVAISICCLIDFPLQIGATLLLFCYLSSVLIAKQFQPNRISKSVLVIWGIVIFTGLGVLITHKTKPLSPYANHTYWLQQAVVLQKSDTQKAQKAFFSAIRTAPLHSRAIRLYGLSLRTTDMEKSIYFTAQATKMAPQNALTWMSLAELYNLHRDSEKSWAAWKRCLALDLPNNDAADRYIRLALISGSQPQNAFLHALPNRVDRKRQAAIILAEWGYDAEAESLFKQLITNDSESKIAYANFFLQRKKYVSAWRLLKNMRPTNCLIAKTKAKTLNRLNAAIEAKEYYRVAISKCGKKENFVNGLLYMRIRLLEDKAIEQAQKKLQQSPEQHILRRELMYALLKSQDIQTLQKHLQYLVDNQEATTAEIKALENVKQNRLPKSLKYKTPIHTKSLNME